MPNSMSLAATIPGPPVWKQTEKQFSDAVVEYARLCGWLVHRDPTWRATGADPGYPDLTLVRAPRVVFSELKTEKGRLTEAQQQWCGLLKMSYPGVEYYLWKPSDWPEIERVLA